MPKNQSHCVKLLPVSTHPPKATTVKTLFCHRLKCRDCFVQSSECLGIWDGRTKSREQTALGCERIGPRPCEQERIPRYVNDAGALGAYMLPLALQLGYVLKFCCADSSQLTCQHVPRKPCYPLLNLPWRGLGKLLHFVGAKFGILPCSIIVGATNINHHLTQVWFNAQSDQFVCDPKKCRLNFRSFLPLFGSGY